MTTKEVAELLGIAAPSVRRLVERGLLDEPVAQVGRARFWTSSQIHSYIERAAVASDDRLREVSSPTGRCKLSRIVFDQGNYIQAVSALSACTDQMIRLLGTRRLLRILRVPRGRLYHWVRVGVFPKPAVKGHRKMWLAEDILRWLELVSEVKGWDKQLKLP